MKIGIDVEVNQTVETELDLNRVIDEINSLPIAQRWNCLAGMLNGVGSDLANLTDEQKDIVKKFLKNKIEMFDE